MMTPTVQKTWQWQYRYATLPPLFYQSVHPTPVKKPSWVVLNKPLAQDLGLDPQWLRENGLHWLAGNSLPSEVKPLAQAYAGHQFGYFTLLGDGRAILLGEHQTPSGQVVDIQLKGAGQTPYSRRGDGRAPLGPMLREYIISEAMHALGIPTTRSLAVIATGESVHRERDYPGAVLTRVAQSHVRVGTFEFAQATGEPDAVKSLADWVIDQHIPEVRNAADPYQTFLKTVMERQARLIAQWQGVGFIHGVMNTDNMAISGETIDYGPCAFMDEYDPATVFSSIDRQGRYAYQNQPIMAQWNLARLAEALIPLLSDDEAVGLAIAKQTVSDFTALYQQHWLAVMRPKLGLSKANDQDTEIIQGFLNLLQTQYADWTNSFRALSEENISHNPLFSSDVGQRWLTDWQARLKQEFMPWEETQALMNQHNPVIIPRNHQVHRALQAAETKGDVQPLHNLLQALATPFEATPDKHPYTSLPSDVERVTQTFCGT